METRIKRAFPCFAQSLFFFSAHMTTAYPCNPCFLPVLICLPFAEPSINALFSLFAAAQTANILSIQYRNVGQMTQKRYFCIILHLFSLAYCVCQIKMRLLHYQTTATERAAKNESHPISPQVWHTVCKFIYIVSPTQFFKSCSHSQN